MSIINMVQNFVSQLSSTVNEIDNPLGLSKGQIDEINHILQLVKAIISDGLQRGDITNLIGLLGELAGAMPDMADELKAIINGLKELAKELFDDPDAIAFGKTSLDDAIDPDSIQSVLSDQLGINTSTPGGLLAEVMNIPDLSSQSPESSIDDEISLLLKLPSINQKRFDVAERVLNFVNDHMVLSTVNFNELGRGLDRIKRRAETVNTNQTVDRNKSDGRLIV